MYTWKPSNSNRAWFKMSWTWTGNVMKWSMLFNVDLLVLSLSPLLWDRLLNVPTVKQQFLLCSWSFSLAQLHQLRGRVGFGVSPQAYSYLPQHLTQTHDSKVRGIKRLWCELHHFEDLGAIGFGIGNTRFRNPCAASLLGDWSIPDEIKVQLVLSLHGYVSSRAVET